MNRTGVNGFHKGNETRVLLDRRKIVGCFIVVVLVVGFIGVLYVIPEVSTHFHYEVRLNPPGPETGGIIIKGFKDTNVSITFVDDPTLWYRMDVTLYRPVRSYEVSVQSWDNHYFLALDGAKGRIKDITLALGSGISYEISLGGVNVNATVIYDNCAKLDSRGFHFTGSGILRFKLTENVNFTSNGMTVVIGHPYVRDPTEYVVLDIDLPDGLNGRVRTGHVYDAEVSGWSNYSDPYQGLWSTSSTDEPLLYILVGKFFPVTANLRD